MSACGILLAMFKNNSKIFFLNLKLRPHICSNYSSARRESAAKGKPKILFRPNSPTASDRKRRKAEEASIMCQTHNLHTYPLYGFRSLVLIQPMQYGRKFSWSAEGGGFALQFHASLVVSAVEWSFNREERGVFFNVLCSFSLYDALFFVTWCFFFFYFIIMCAFFCRVILLLPTNHCRLVCRNINMVLPQCPVGCPVAERVLGRYQVQFNSLHKLSNKCNGNSEQC